MTSAQRHTWWLWDKFKSADKDGNGELEIKEVKKFFKSINLEMNDKSFKVRAQFWNLKFLKLHFKELFAKYDKKKRNSLSWENIKEMYAVLLIPEEFRDLYKQISGEDEARLVFQSIVALIWPFFNWRWPQIAPWSGF